MVQSQQPPPAQMVLRLTHVDREISETFTDSLWRVSFDYIVPSQSGRPSPCLRSCTPTWTGLGWGCP